MIRSQPTLACSWLYGGIVPDTLFVLLDATLQQRCVDFCVGMTGLSFSVTTQWLKKPNSPLSHQCIEIYLTPYTDSVFFIIQYFL